MLVALVYISSVYSYEVIESCPEYVITAIVTEIVPFEVMKKNKTLYIINTLKRSTFINSLRDCKFLSCSMCYNFSPPSCSPSTATSYVVIALYPEGEITSSFYHFVIGLLIVIILFHVLDVILDFTTAAGNNQVNNISKKYDENSHCDKKTA